VKQQVARSRNGDVPITDDRGEGVQLGRTGILPETIPGHAANAHDAREVPTEIPEADAADDPADVGDDLPRRRFCSMDRDEAIVTSF
jgi:hypothetical protein